jgi:hypothetical protein
MLLATTLLSSAFFFTASAVNPHTRTTLTGNKHASTRALASRQHREPRAPIDTCINLNTDLISYLGFPELPSQIDTHIDVCLCLSGLNVYLSSDVSIRAIVGAVADFFSEDDIRVLLTTLVRVSFSAGVVIEDALRSPRVLGLSVAPTRPRPTLSVLPMIAAILRVNLLAFENTTVVSVPLLITTATVIAVCRVAAL